MFSKLTLVGIGLIVFPVLYQYYYHYEEYQSAMSDHRKKEEMSSREMSERIAIGLNADIDYILSALDLLRVLERDEGGTGQEVKPVNHRSISTIKELRETVYYSMSTCSGIERFFEDKTIFDKIVKTASKLKHEEYVGGNAALMANKIAEISPKSKILLAAPIGSKLRQYINSSIETVSPPSVQEEIHIILEYATGEEVGGVTATCANRVIISHDVANSRLNSLEVFAEALDSFDPTLVILSGLHMLEGRKKGKWNKRLNDVKRVLAKVSRYVPIHLEMATVGNLEFLPLLADTILPYVNSLGLNEQELTSLAKSKNAQFDFNVIGPKPGIPDSGDLLYWLYNTYTDLREGKNDEESRLSRIHFHSLSFHILVVPKRELAGVKWDNSLQSARLGSRIASLQACQLDEINNEDFELQIPDEFPLSHIDKSLKGKYEYKEENGYMAWNRDGAIDYNMIPVHVCKSPLKTVGLGDAISATGLLNSKYSYTERRLRKRVKKTQKERI